MPVNLNKLLQKQRQNVVEQGARACQQQMKAAASQDDARRKLREAAYKWQREVLGGPLVEGLNG
jgi:hypothetical protein